MRKTVQSLSDEIVGILRMNAKDVITIPWPSFYALVGRERIKEAFQVRLSRSLNEHSLLICYGHAVVLIAKDFNFSSADL